MIYLNYDLFKEQVENFEEFILFVNRKTSKQCCS